LPTALSFTDVVPALALFSYGVLAVDAGGNVSLPSRIVQAAAFDDTPPEPAVPAASWIEGDASGPRMQVAWSSAHETMLQVRAENLQWLPMSGWFPPGSHEHFVDDVVPSVAHDLRLWARKETGAIAIGQLIHLPPV
jgi:hypothetical protein